MPSGNCQVFQEQIVLSALEHQLRAEHYKITHGQLYDEEYCQMIRENRVHETSQTAIVLYLASLLTSPIRNLLTIDVQL